MSHIPPQTTAQQIAERPRRALIAEADRSAAEMLQELLIEERWEASLASDVDDACAQLRQGGWTVALVSSYSQTGQNPEQWTELQRMVRAAGSTRVVLLTGHAIDMPTALQLGLEGVIRKPFDVLELADFLQRLLIEDEPS